MFQKTVIATFTTNDGTYETKIDIPCTPETSDEELIRHAGNILKSVINNVIYKIVS